MATPSSILAGIPGQRSLGSQGHKESDMTEAPQHTPRQATHVTQEFCFDPVVFKIPAGKRIENNDNKDDPRSQKKNGSMDQEDKDLEELKNKQTVMNNTKTKMKNRLERIHSRITEAA